MTAPPPEALKLRHLVLGYRLSRCIAVAAELGIADLLADGPRPIGEIAAAVSADPAALYRVMRLLASEGIFSEVRPRCFALTSLAEPLRADHPSSLRERTLFYMAPPCWGSTASLGEAVRSARPAFEHAFGTDLFSYLAARPDEAEVFHRAMVEQTAEIGPELIRAYPFPDSGTLVDVGGGLGALIEAVVRQHPGISGVLFDQPHVIAAARDRLASVGLGNVTTVAGDFFDAVPPGAELYALKFILHDWDDERCSAILKVCRKAMTPHSRLLIIEIIVPSGNEPHYGKYLDVSMLVLTPGGRERTEEEYAALLSGAGLRLDRHFPTGTDFAVLEASPD
jgi:hypothetical protein